MNRYKENDKTWECIWIIGDRRNVANKLWKERERERKKKERWTCRRENDSKTKIDVRVESKRKTASSLGSKERMKTEKDWHW